jgi:GntR family transcriptional regulator
MLQKDLSTPLHLQLSSLLRQQIQTNRLSPNSPLPSERELCEKYGVSRITVRQALADLQREGLVYSVAGKGSYVTDTKLEEELQPFKSFTEEMQKRSLKASSRILDAGIANSDDEHASRLRIPRGAEIVRLYRLRLADNIPIALQLTCLPHYLCPDLLKFDLAQNSLYAILRSEYHLHMVRAETSISAGMVRPQECEWLQLSFPGAVLITKQTTYLENDVVIEFTQSIFRSDRYNLTIHTCK